MTVAGKISTMIIHETQPLQIETPLSLLNQNRLTDISHIYVRNNLGLKGTETTAPHPSVDWCIHISGLVHNPFHVSLESLHNLEQHDVEMVLQCSGNSRALFNHIAPVEGSIWHHGTVANVCFTGIPLRYLLEQCAPQTNARYLTAKSSPNDNDFFERSVPLRDALETGLLALKLNGQPLPAIHGGPLRLIIPGYYGVNHVKWLTHLSLDATPCSSYYQSGKYRLPLHPIKPGDNFLPSEDNSRPSWRMNVKSIVLKPLKDSIVSSHVQISGVAWTDGRSEIECVKLSFDHGKTWQYCELFPNQNPFSWQEWKYDAHLMPGIHEVRVKATDTYGRSQPINATENWNPFGYECNAIDKVSFNVD